MSHVDIFKRRKESLEKVKITWKSIIERYGNLGPKEQGDLVDISTGQIIQDHGHLRSMAYQSTLWRDPIENSNHQNQSISSREESTIANLTPNSNSILTNSSPHRLSRSQHLTRSKIVDNLTVSQPSESESDDLKMDGSYYIKGMDTSSNDPLNILMKHADPVNPSKTRRLRKAIIASKARKPNDRTRLHQLVKKSRRNPTKFTKSFQYNTYDNDNHKYHFDKSNRYDPIIIG